MIDDQLLSTNSKSDLNGLHNGGRCLRGKCQSAEFDVWSLRVIEAVFLMFGGRTLGCRQRVPH
jgi:hypothetical protein